MSIVLVQTLVVVVGVWLAWTHAAASAAPMAGHIHGQLLAGADAAPNETVALRLYGGENDVEVVTTTTTISGSYEFANPSTPPDGWTYYVQFGPNNTNPAYVAYWVGPDISNYQAGEDRSVGDFDIADVKLVAPAPDAVARLPLVFEWTPRGNSADVYGVHLVNLMTGEDSALDSGGDQSTATLSEADAARLGLAYGTRYYWYVGIRDSGTPGSFGASFGAWDITFARHQVYLPLLSANPPLP
ncbi:MAG: hypothetical protein KIT87_02045 [Anaerolineae bacterium]|nr:hypothetical protein [Anaerolineae bacterium]